MIQLRVFLSRALDLILRRPRDERLSEELQVHLDMLTEDLVAQGLSPSEARLAARRRFGAVDRVTADYREQRGLPLADALWQDARFGMRMLGRDRAFTVTAVLVLALGIGVNNMLFTVLYAHTMRGLPIPGADRVQYLTTVDDRSADRGISFVEFEELRKAVRNFAGVAAFTGAPVVMSGDGRTPDRVEGSYASGNAFAVLDIRPVLGRGLEPDDDQRGRPPVAVLGQGTWHSRYAGDPRVLGRSVLVNGSQVTIVGVVPDRSGFPSTAGVWLPLSLSPGLSTQPRAQRSVRAFGRLQPGASAAAAAAEVEAFFARLSVEHPNSNRNVRGRAMPINERYLGRLTDLTWLAFMAVGFLIVTISAANVANLMLARSAQRAREIAIRTSLGATRLRVIRQLMMEGTLLAGLGGLAGLGVAAGGVRLFRSAIPEDALPYWFEYSMDARVAGALVGVSVATVLVFALVPALKASRPDLTQVLKTGGRGGPAARTTRRWTTAFLAAEFALAVVLLAQLSVNLRAARPALPSDGPIETDAVVTAGITLPSESYAEPNQRAQFYRRLDERLRSVPGVHSMSVTTVLPRSGGKEQRLEIAGRATPDPGGALSVLTVAVGPRYFETLALSMRRGREFSRQDAGSPAGAIINERGAAQLFGDRDPLGHAVALSEAGAAPSAAHWLTIIGIAPDIRQRPGADPASIIYVPLQDVPPPTAFVLVRGAAAPDPLAASLREQVQSLDEGLPVYRVRTMRDVVHESDWPGRVSAGLFLALTGIAVGLSIVGLYAVAAHGVSQRTHEIGVRMALGARPSSVVRMVVRTALIQVAIGFVAGLGCTVVWGSLFSSGQAGIRATDPASLAIVAGALIVCASIACVVPARRATRLDPLAAIRQE